MDQGTVRSPDLPALIGPAEESDPLLGSRVGPSQRARSDATSGPASRGLRERLDALPVVGRRVELSRLSEALGRAGEGRGSSWMIFGSSGMGKTRLLHRVSELAARRGFSVHWSHGLRASSTPLFLFLQLLQSQGVSDGAGPAGDSRGSRAEEIRFLEDARRRGMPGTGVPFPSKSGVRPRTFGRARAYSVDTEILDLVRELEERSREQPLLLILDDLQWAEPESFRALRLISRMIRTLRVMVIAALRDDQFFEWETNDPRRVELLDARRSGAIDWLELGPLGGTEGVSLAARVLGEDGPRLAVREGLRELVDRCGGNPYFIIESVLTAVDTGRFVRTRRGWLIPETSAEAGRKVESLPSPVPEPIRSVLVERFRALSEQNQRPLIVAARMGMSFDTDALAAALREPKTVLLHRFEHLASVGWPIHRSDPTPGQFEFDHSFLRESVADPAEFPVAQDVIYRAAAWYVAHRPEETLTQAGLLLESGHEGEAFAVVEEAIARAIPRHAARQVLALLDWVARELPVEARTFRLFLDAGASLRALLDYETYPAIAERLLRLNPPEMFRWQARIWLLEAAARRDVLGTTREVSELREEISRSHRDVPAALRAEIDVLTAIQHVWADPPSRALAYAARTLTRMKSGTSPLDLLRLSNAAVTCAVNNEMATTARHWLEVGQKALKSRDLRDSPASLLLGLSEAYVARAEGDTARSRKLCEALIDRCRKLRSPVMEAQALNGLASNEMDILDWERARGPLATAMSIATRLDMRPLLTQTLVNLGWIEFQEGQLDFARGHLSRAGKLMESMVFYRGHNIGRLTAAFVRAAAGDLEGARRDLSTTRPSVRTDPMHWRITWYQARARVEYHAGRWRNARSELRRALTSSRAVRTPYSQLSTLQELAALEAERGSRRRQLAWEREAVRFARRHGLDPHRDWKGAGYPNSVQTGKRPRFSEAPSGSSTEVPPERTMSDRVLLYFAPGIRGARGAGRMRSSAAGETESSIAQGLGVPRARFARALRRLEEKGWLLRTRSRAAGGRRTVFLYTLTPAGRTRANELAKLHLP